MNENKSEAREPIWAVLVVHGVGFTRPGQTLESFISGLRTSRSNGLDEIGPPEVLMLDKAPETLQPHAHEEHASDPKISLRDRFPMHQRWIRMTNPREDTPSKAVFAEVFWSDISSTRNHALSILLQLLTMIFQLRFVVDRAATMPDGTARWFRFILYLGSVVLCGPIAALNVMILILLLSHFVGVKLQSWTTISIDGGQIHLALIVIGLAIFITAIVITIRKHDERSDNPWRLLSVWLAASGLALAALAALKILAPDAALLQQFDQVLLYEFGFGTPPDVLSFYFFSLMLFVRWSFALLLALLLLAIASWSWSSFKARWYSKKELIPGLTAAVGLLILQIGLWVVIIPALALWVFQQLSMEDLVRPDGPFGQLQTYLVLNLVLAAIVVFCIVGTWLGRFLWVRKHAQDYSDVNVARSISRLLISNTIFAGLFATSVMGILLASVIVAAAGDLIDSYTAWIIGGIAALMTIVALVFLQTVGSALHILMDIVSHFIMARLPIPWPYGKEKKPILDNLVRQMKIEARFRRALEEVLREGDVSHLTVVSHSQGSVIALDVLWYNWTADLLKKRKVQNLFLITMGSPFTHLYQYYFPVRYPALFLPDGSFNSNQSRGWGQLHETFASKKPTPERCTWINLFRIDDPIGTHINREGIDKSGAFPKNYSLRSGGHTHYWSDTGALEKMKELLPG